MNTEQDTQMLEAIKQWQEYEQARLQHVQESLEQRRYEINKAKLDEDHLSALERAIASRYLNIHGISTKSAMILRWAYEGYCGANAVPFVVIEPGWRKHLAKVRLDLDSMQPHGSWNLYCPKLDLEEDTFQFFTLLVHEYSMSEGHVSFRHVSTEKAEEVARQLLAFFDRQYEKHKSYIDSLMK